MPVEFSRRDEFAVITLNRPEALNALAFSVVEEIDAAIDQAAASDARALIFTGAGDKAFCAGADINELQSLGPIQFRNQMRRGQSVLARLDTLPIISIAAINGFALGGALPRRRRAWGCPRSSLARCRAMAAHSGCRG